MPNLRPVLRKHILGFFFLLYGLTLNAQLSGVYSVPGNFATIANAISTVNQFGVTGPVTINIAAGYTETAIPGGYTLQSIIGSSSLNKVIFQKAGLGPNPIIYAYSGGTATSLSAKQDGIWRFNGTDNVEINGIDLMDLNTSNPASMEFGYGFFKANASDGCQNNSITNCTITLQRINNVAGAGPVLPGSKGIEVVNASILNHTTALVVATAIGSNSGNKFFGNTILQTNIGICISGYASPAPYNLADQGNEVGGVFSGQGNSIQNFGGGGSVGLAAGIYILAQYNAFVANNFINSNSGGGSAHLATIFAIRTESVYGNVTIASNTLSIKAGATSTLGYAIANEGSSSLPSSSLIAQNNVITGCTSSGSSSFVFHGIFNAAPIDNLVYNGNVFTSNFFVSNTSFSSLLNNSGRVNTQLSINNNSISVGFVSSFSGTICGVTHTSSVKTNSISISNNDFQTFSFSGSGSIKYITAAGLGDVLTVNANRWNNNSAGNTGPIILIENNCTISSMVSISSNSIIGGYTRTAAAGNFVGYTASNLTTIEATLYFTNNNFSNITATTSGAGTFKAFYIDDGVMPGPKIVMANNMVANVTYSSSGTNDIVYIGRLGALTNNTISSVYGNTVTNITCNQGVNAFRILLEPYKGAAIDIRDNEISNISAIGQFAFARAFEVISNLATAKIFRNKIANINSTGTTDVYGMYFSGGKTYVYNNIVANITCPFSLQPNSVNGMQFSFVDTARVYNNTVYLAGNTYGSNGISINSFFDYDIQNNLIVNKCTAAANGSVIAVRLPYDPIAGGNRLIANNNVYYAGSAGPANLLYYNGTIGYTTISALRSSYFGVEQNSATENVVFSSTVSSNPLFMYPSVTASTAVESAAVPIAMVAGDFYQTPRNTAFPDIGALESNYMGFSGDLLPPNISNASLINSTCNLGQITLTANISDPSGIGTGTASPKVYYKLNTSTYSVSSGSLVAGTPTSGVWSFTLSYNAAYFDSVSYFFAAQDNATLSNVSTFPSTFASGQSVNSITATPIPFKYKIYYSLSGTYTVGAGGTFTTLSAAAKAYNTACLNGPVIFLLSNTSYSVNEIYPITFERNPQASTVNSLLIRPQAAVSATVFGSSIVNSNAIIKLKDARYITIDGVNSSGTALTLMNTLPTNGLIPANLFLASSLYNGGGNNNISILNTKFNSTVTNTLSFGVSLAKDDPISAGLNGFENDTILISGNDFLNLATGLSALGTNTANNPYLCASNLTITNNQFGPTTQGSNTLTTGMSINNIANFVIANNTITNCYSSSLTSNAVGLYSGPGVREGTITANTINAIKTSWLSAHGIMCFSTDLLISNNMISDIGMTAFSPFDTYLDGVYLNNATRIKLYHNTIALTQGTTFASYTKNIYANAIEVQFGLQNEMVDNIFYNNVENVLTPGIRSYACYAANVFQNFGKMDHNNFYVSGSSAVLARYGSNNISTLTALKNSFGQNLNSSSSSVDFVSASDVHIDQSSLANFSLQDLGTPIGGIVIDIDGQTRGVPNPDIGADEWQSTASCTSAIAGVAAAVSSVVCNSQTIQLNVSGNSFGANAGYQWQISGSAAGTYTNVTNGVGANTPTYNVSTLTPGVYYYRFISSCPSLSLSNISNVVTVSVTAAPSLSVAISSPSVCGGQTTLTASGATSYTWNTGSTNTSVAVSGSATAIYNVTYSTVGCSIGTSSNIIVYASVQPTVSIVASSSVSCDGSAVTLLASGASSYAWNGISGTSSIAVTPTSTSMYTVVGGLGSCTSAAVYTVLAGSSPSLSIAGSTSICIGQTATLQVNGAAAYLWSSASTQSQTTLSPSVTTVYTVSGTSATGCTASETVSIFVAPPMTLAISGPSIICSGQTTTLLASGGVTYTWSSGVTGNSAVVSPTASAVFTLTAASGVCNQSLTKTINVLALPTVTVNSGAICSGQLFTLSPGGALGYTYSAGSNTVAPISNSTYTVIGIDAAGCTNSAVSSITVNSLPTVSVANGTVCLGQSFTLVPTGAATYSFYSISSVVNPTVTTTYSVSGISAAGCISTNTAIATISVISTPDVSVTSGTVCQGQPFVLIPSGAASYSFSSGTATVLPSITSTFTATGSATNGCSSSAVATVIVLPAPTISLTSGSICAGNAFTIAPTGAQTYTIEGGSFVVTPTATSIYTVVGTGTNNCQSVTYSSIQVIVNPLPFITVNSGTVCSGTAFQILPQGAAAYTLPGNQGAVTPSITTSYSIVGVSAEGCVASNTAVSTVTVIAVPQITVNSGSICEGQSFTITPLGASSYSYSGAGPIVTPTVSSTFSITGFHPSGCFSSGQSSVTVLQAPVLSAQSGSICAGQIFTLSPTGAVSYTYSSNTTTVSPLLTTTYSIIGTGTNNCSSTSPLIVSVAVYSLPIVQVSSSTLCAGETITLQPIGASTYTYFNGGPVLSPTATTTYSLRGISAEGCFAQVNSTLQITVLNSPTVTVNSGTICQGNTFTLQPGGASTYTFSSGSATLSPLSNTVITVSGTFTNGCITATTSSISVLNAPTIGISNGTLCSGQSYTFTPTGASSYTYSSNSNVVSPLSTSSFSIVGTGTNNCVSLAPSVVTLSVFQTPTVSVPSATICSGASYTISPTGTSSYSYSSIAAVVSPTISSTYTVVGYSANNCQSAPASLTVSVLTTPQISAVNGTICSGGVFTISPQGAQSYTNLSNPSFTVSPLVSTNYSVVGSGTNTCVSDPIIVSVTVLSSPTLSITGTNTLCTGNSLTLTATGATSYSWSTGATGSSIVVTPAVSTQYSVLASIVANCVASGTQSVLVYQTPTLSISGPTSVCSGNSILLSALGAVNAYTWNTGSNSGNIVVTPTATAVYSLIAQDQNNCKASAVKQIVFFQNPNVTANITQTIVCEGRVLVLTASGAQTYTWTDGITNGVPFTVNGSAQHTVTGADANGCSDTALVKVIALPSPTITISASAPNVCAGENVTLTALSTSTVNWSTADTTSIVIVQPNITTTYVASSTGGNGCVRTASYLVSVDPCTGVSKTFEQEIVTCYPSPTSGKLWLTLRDYDEAAELLIYANNGALILQQRIVDKNTLINLHEFANGIYFYKIVNLDKQVLSGKFILEK